MSLARVNMILLRFIVVELVCVCIVNSFAVRCPEYGLSF